MGNIPPAPSHKPPNLSLSLASPSSAEFKSCPSPQRCVPSTPPPQFRPLLSSQLTAQPSWPPAPPLRSVPIHTASKVLFPKRNLATCTLNLFGNSLLQSRLSPRQDWQERHDLPSLSCPHQVSALSPQLPTHPPGGPCLFVCSSSYLEPTPSLRQLPANLCGFLWNLSFNSQPGPGAPPLCSQPLLLYGASLIVLPPLPLPHLELSILSKPKHSVNV